jgi:hypothetical protein
LRGILEAATASSSPASAVRAFGAWAVDGRSWRRIAYLILALPLSCFYSVVILIGLSLAILRQPINDSAVFRATWR